MEAKEKKVPKRKAGKKKVLQKGFPRNSKREPEGGISSYLDKSRLISLSLFLFFTLTITLLCSTRQSPSVFQVTEGKEARKGIIAKFEFEYKSDVQTERLKEERSRKVHPIYKLTQDPYNQFEAFLKEFLISQNEILQARSKMLPEEIDELISQKITEIQQKNEILVNRSIYDNFLKFENRNKILAAFREGLLILKEIYSNGVVDTTSDADSQEIVMFKLSGKNGNTFVKEVMTMEDALRRLRLNLRVIQIEESLPDGLYHLFRTGLKSNLVFDEAATEAKIAEEVSKIEPVIIKVEEGMNIIEEGKVVTEKDYERYTTYFENIINRNNVNDSFLTLFLERLLMVTSVIIAILVYFYVIMPEIAKNNRMLSISGMALLVSMVVIRILFEFGSTRLFKANPEYISVLPYLSPVMLAGMITVMMMGVGPAMVTSVAMSCFYAVIQDGSIEMLVLSMVSSFVSILFCRDIRFRSSIVRAGAMGGLTMATLALIIGLMNHYDFLLIGWHIVASVIVGIITGVIAIGVIPVFETAFNRSTEISLLELTDFNHPLLRRLQNEAPGTYQHSMMVANLSENAAMAIGCSPLVCRVCSLFHDIGKLVKPEYFTENQRDGTNPHMDRNPSMSALVIKSHVKEGIELARRYGLPLIIRDVIRQHHGTSLIQYFYYEALKKSTGDNLDLPDAPHVSLDKVDESTYRYDGPKPQFKESAIIFFADSIEAASRSLKKVNSKSLQELLDHIVKERLEDDQLDESPLTMQEIAQIKESFIYTLLNMYHSRIEYPKGKPEATPQKRETKESDDKSAIEATDSNDSEEVQVETEENKNAS